MLTELLGWIAGAIGAVLIYWIYFGGLNLTLSRGSGTILTAAWLVWGWPFVVLVLFALASGKWKLGAAVLLILIGSVIGGFIGSLIAKWRMNDRFEGALAGALISLFPVGPTVMWLIR